MGLLRTRFGDIVCEFAPSKSKDVLIWCGGMPGYPWRSRQLAWLSKHYWVFFPRYRGTWESGGKFLAKSPEHDVIDIINALPKGFKDLWSGQEYQVKPRKIFIVGASFGGPAAILASKDKRVTKVVCLSPVVDWRVPSEDEPLDKLEVYLRSGFGEGYRFSHNDWEKLRKGKIYNPASHVKELDGKKMLIVHCKDDRSIPYESVEQFSKDVGAKLITFNKGGHGGSSKILRPWNFWRVKRFLNS